MSSSSPREIAATDATAIQANLASRLQAQGLPEIQNMIDMVTRETSGGYGSMLPMVRNAFEPVEDALKSDYGQAQASSAALIAQRAKQSGGIFGPNAVSDATTNAANLLNQDMTQAMSRLKLRETQANVSTWDQLMNIVGGGTRGSLGFMQADASLWNQAIGGMSNTSQMGSIVGGAGTGAGVGSAFGPYGTAIGALLGAGVGAATYRG